MSTKLSVVIITYNEEKNIERCLESVQNIADEIVVVDSFSTDKTEEISKKYNVNFFNQKWLGYSAQKNFANSLCKNNFVFSIDADEALSPELEQSIKEIKQTELKNKAFKVNRLTNYCGKWIKHSGWYPDTKLRIWDIEKGAWKGNLHEEIFFTEEPQTITLKGDLYHYSYYSINQHIAQFNKFTDIGAEEAFKKGKKSNLFIAIYKSVWKFKRDYIFKLGFLDGYYGFVICSLSSQATFAKYLKLRELNKNNK
jgi:glycosyltransferase involved in cell wall biosynthesis